jgi:hypothetical protein
MSRSSTLLLQKTPIVIVDDCLHANNCSVKKLIHFIDPSGNSKQSVIEKISKVTEIFTPVIGISLRYNQQTKRTDYEGIRLLLEISENYPDQQFFYLLSFEHLDKLKLREFGYVFEAENIMLISYHELLKSMRNGFSQ